MKWIKYKLNDCVVQIPYNERGCEIAKTEADNGKYYIEETEMSTEELGVLDVVLDVITDIAYRLCILELGGGVA